MKTALRLLLMCVLLLSANVHAQYNPQRYPVIPKPQTLLPFSGNFDLSSNATIVVEHKSLKKECHLFLRQVQELFNLRFNFGKISGNEPCIFVSYDSTGLPPEGYELYINRDGVNLYGTKAGIFYGLQTILQLIQPGERAGTFMLPSCSIIDYPRFTWRGMHLDVARHFFTKEEVKSYLRYMAMYKMNTFHWHLTDDQGWRIEIKKYPRLTSVGAWRKQTLIGHFSEEPDRYDGIPHEGFYTQNEIREVIRYADSLHITIVPEIEMPGHASALLAAYPNAGNNPKFNYEVQGTWGVFNEVMAPTDSTFIMLENILSEVAVLFPGKYIHIGGDECPKTEWEKSEFCQSIIKQNNLKDEHGLQSWFITRIVKFLDSKGKKAIGWDEILEGGLAKGAAVMSWRGEEGGIAAAKAGHNVVMTPGSHCYFDYYQSQNPGEPLAIGGYLPVEKVYSYNPVPQVLNADERRYILGVQSNLWTEYIPDFRQVQYMIFPRMCALSEVAWTRSEIKSFQPFVTRLTAHMNTFDRMKINYSKSIFEIIPRYEKTEEGLLLHLSTYSLNGKITFNTTGDSVNATDAVYTGPILLKGGERIAAAVFANGNQISPVYEQKFESHVAFSKSVTLKKAPSPNYNNGGPATLTDGIIGRRPWTGAQWLGWWGDTCIATIDLGKESTIGFVEISVLHDPGSWIYFPKDFQIEVSTDGKTFTPAEVSPRQPQYESLQKRGIPLVRTQARFVRVTVIPENEIPEGQPGAGHPAWLFVSEIVVR